MMKKILILFLASTACLTLEVFSEITPEEDLEIIRKAIEERRKKYGGVMSKGFGSGVQKGTTW